MQIWEFNGRDVKMSGICPRAGITEDGLGIHITELYVSTQFPPILEQSGRLS